jgi:hypothetical protein
MTLKTTYGPKNLRHTGLGPYVRARMVGPVCRTPIWSIRFLSGRFSFCWPFYSITVDELVRNGWPHLEFIQPSSTPCPQACFLALC